MKIIKIICSIYITLMCCLYFNTIDIHASSNILSKTFECTLDETEEKKISNITNKIHLDSPQYEIISGFDFINRYVIAFNKNSYLIFDRLICDFTEYSKCNTTPFEDFDASYDKIYLAPSYYFVVKNDVYIDISSQKKLVVDEISVYKEFECSIAIKAIESNKSKLSLDDDYICIKDYYYFLNLKDNMGTNDSDLYTGSCGFVSAEMILGYYDSYYNDNIIGESFDVTTSYDFDNYSSINIMSYDNSPGIDDVFHQYLINYAYSNNLITNNFILTISNVETLLELYLTYKNISYNMHTHNSAFNVVTFCENYIDNEYPVVALILMGLEGHFVVAYGYDEDSIIANFGWKGTNVATNIRNYFISGAFCLEINDSHICSNNYEWTSCGCTGIVCPCCTITCNHGNYSYSTYSNFYHKKTCVLCGNIGYEAHILTYNGNYYVCANCGYIENHIHSYSYLPRGDGKRHIASCTCGESKLEMCIGYIQLGGSSVCMYCGQTIR